LLESKESNYVYYFAQLGNERRYSRNMKPGNNLELFAFDLDIMDELMHSFFLEACLCSGAHFDATS
jgi:hypothetical protein